MSINKIGKECCGCRTCKTVCSFNAISVEQDKYGFEYMKVNPDLCKDCGICESVCPVISVPTVDHRFSCGAAYALNDKVKYNGSSGGLFGVFAKKIIDEHGIVFGAAYDNNLKLKTTCAETADALLPLYKSKYLLCDTDDQFVKIKEELNKGRKVLYCSSPCQVAALKLYLHHEYSNLLTVDFVCHGVGSQSLFDKSIEYSQNRLNAKIRNVIFRYKAKGASSHYYYYYYESKKKSYIKTDLYLSFPYYNAYCKQLACREGCYDCKYATEGRVSDITIGDFHSIEKYDSSIDRFAGVSMYVCNTQQGENFLQTVKQDLYIKLFDWDILKSNNRFCSGGKAPNEHDAFMDSVAMEPFKKTVARFLKPSRDWKRLIYYKSPALLRNIVRKKFGE